MSQALSARYGGRRRSGLVAAVVAALVLALVALATHPVDAAPNASATDAADTVVAARDGDTGDGDPGDGDPGDGDPGDGDPGDGDPGDPGDDYRATIRRTSFGIPHVIADDVPGVTFGVGYAFAQDNACVLLEEMVAVRSRRSVTFGASDANRTSDLFFARLRELGRVDDLLAGADGPAPSEEIREAVRAYVAGFNHYLEVAGDELTDPACAGEDWVEPLTEDDLWLYYHSLLMRAGESAVRGGIVAAQPPQVDAAGSRDSRTLRAQDLDEAAAWLDAAFDAGGPMGSNAYALGSEVTRDGTGMLLANPHFPWSGPQRFYRMHLTVPGDLDVSGASLYGLPVVNIGHNESLAWSHTVSTANRFTLHLLQLDPEDPTRYLVDGEPRALTPVEVSIEEPGAGNATRTVTHTFWESHLGPVIQLGPIEWTAGTALVISDVNATNGRAPDTWLAVNRADSIESLRAALDTYQGIPWVNTIAADDTGTAMYADHSVVPNLEADTIDACRVFEIQGRVLLDGSRSDCEPGDAPDAAAPGILPPARLPVLVRDDYVANMNNSHWLANPEQPLEGFSPLIGTERGQLDLRARLGLLMIEQRLDGSDGLEGDGFTLANLQQIMFNNRSLGAELVVDDLVEACREAGTVTVEVDGDDVEVALDEACDVLEEWDRTANLDSRGAHVFREFVAFGGLAFTEEFDVEAPLTTPTGLDTDDAAVLEALGLAVHRFTSAGVALDARLGDVQYVTRNGVRTEIHGGPPAEGIFNVVGAPFNVEDGAYSEVFAGASFVMTVEFTDDGPVSEALLPYSQSTDPTSPHYADQLAPFRDQDWIPMRFREADILADPALEVTEVNAPRPAPAPEPPMTFSDVDPGNVHAEAIGRLAAAGILTGRADGTFGPSEPMRRGQVALVLDRAFSPEASNEAAFPDVPGDGELADAVNATAAAGWISGFDDGSFRPDVEVTRGQLASMVARALDLEPVEEAAFDDLDGNVHAPAINALAALGVVNGVADGRFDPSALITRAQAASMLDRALSLP